jgi:D-serine deaminase-like pyridoxal phosphate-dependent protein
MELALGIRKHKCATIAEADMLAGVGAEDVLIAYPIVGPNCQRLAGLMTRYPKTRFSVLADHPDGIRQLSEAMTAAGRTLDVLLDIDVGQHRTGVPPGARAVELYEMIAQQPGLRADGLQVYDGHNHQESLDERRAAVRELLAPVLSLRESLDKKRLPVPRTVVGGTPTFGVWAEQDLPGMECSPGTCVLHDHGYGRKYPELGMTPAALLLTRVVSRPTPERVTFDLGTKSVASDPPAGQRCIVLDLPNARAIIHNEEHLVVETPEAERFRPGDTAYAMPTHICPSCALHRYAHIVENGELVDRWEIAARDRVLTV